MLTIAIIDGMGGGIGAQIAGRLRKEAIAGVSLVALGTNAVATQRMIEAGADRGASGENAIRVTVVHSNFVVGPIGIVLPNALMGEITPGIAEAILNAPARKLLLPLNQPHVTIVGLPPKNINELIDESVAVIVHSVVDGAEPGHSIDRPGWPPQWNGGQQ
jgi:hypothetical protein